MYNMSTFSFNPNLYREILSPLEQFELRSLISLEAPILGDLHISITNIGFYLTIGGIFILVLKLLSTNYNKLVSNNWSISQESLYATIHSIVTNQINGGRGQMYFPFIYTLFIFILINNLIGMVKRCLLILFLFISNILFAIVLCKHNFFSLQQKKFDFSHLYSYIHTKTSKNSTPARESLRTPSGVPQGTRYSFNNKNTFYLNPDYVTGFVDGEGCFTLSIFKDDRRSTGWQVKPIFSISLHNRDIKLLEALQRTFNVGKIYKHGPDSVQYRVSSLSNLQVIVEHFDKYPLKTLKHADYVLFKQAINLIINKEHLSLVAGGAGLLKLVSIKATLNWGLSEKLKYSFPSIIPVDRPKVEFNSIKNFNWIRGFIEGEGSFQVVIQEIKNKTNISLRLSITQHIRDEELLKNIVTYLNCGRYYKSPTRDEAQYLVTNFSDISNKIIPLLNEYPLIGVKREDYLDFVKIANLIKSKDHLTEEGIENIKFIRNNMNKRRILIKE